MKSFVFSGRSGCLLPFLIMFNFLFGWIFLKPLYWFLVELALLFLFIISGYIIMRKVTDVKKKRGDVIDIEADVVEDKRRLK